MRHARAIAGTLLVGVIAFAGAWWVRERRADAVPRHSRWAPDTAAATQDARTLTGALRRIPAPLPGQALPRVGEHPDVVVIVLDTVRADRLGLYGYDRATSPQLDAWSREARVYERLRAPAPWTLPSHAALFTGRISWETGADGTPPGVKALARPLAQGADTLAGRLRAQGWRTVGIAANKAFLNGSWGLGQGFDAWVCQQLPQDRWRLPYTSADRMAALARQALKAPREQPLFLFLNFMDAHAPYLAREGFVPDGVRVDTSVLPFTPRWAELNERLLATGKLDPEVQRSWSEGYDAGLRFLDAHLGPLLADLPSLGIGPEDHVILLSDHGEYLGEHGHLGHSQDVYEEVLHVPFVWRGPGVTPGRDPRAVQTQDVPTMLLTALGLPGFREPLPLEVSELYWSRKRDLDNPVYGKRFARVRRAFARGSHKVIVGDDGSFEAYDLASDPDEANDVSATGPWAAPLRAEAEALLATLPYAERGDEPEGAGANTEALRALGYVE